MLIGIVNVLKQITEKLSELAIAIGTTETTVSAKFVIVQAALITFELFFFILTFSRDQIQKNDLSSPEENKKKKAVQYNQNVALRIWHRNNVVAFCYFSLQ